MIIILKQLFYSYSIPLIHYYRPKEKRFGDSAEMEGKVMVRIQGRKMTLCKHYLHGNCKNGSNCNYLHDPCRKNKSLCKPFIRGYCARVGNVKIRSSTKTVFT